MTVTGPPWVVSIPGDVEDMQVSGPPWVVSIGPIRAEDFRGSRFRGVNGFVASEGSLPPAEDFDRIKAWGYNFVRCWLVASWNGSAYVIDAPQLARMDAGLALLGARQLRAVVVVSISKADMPWTIAPKLAAFAALHGTLAARFLGSSVVIAIDMMNEPDIAMPFEVATAQDYTNCIEGWRVLAVQCAAAIRAVDPTRVVWYEPAMVANPTQMRTALPLANYVTSPHVYDPFAMTHQGVFEQIAGTPFTPDQPFDAGNAALLAEAIALVADWPPDLPICVGEFACVRWAPSNAAALWTAAAIVAFEAAGLSWCHHEFRRYTGWDAEGPNSTATSYTRSDDAPVAAVLRAALALPPGYYTGL